MKSYIAYYAVTKSGAKLPVAVAPLCIETSWVNHRLKVVNLRSLPCLNHKHFLQTYFLLCSVTLFGFNQLITLHFTVVGSAMISLVLQ